MSAKDENPIIIKVKQIIANERKRDTAACKGDYSETQRTCNRLLEKIENSTRLDELTAGSLEGFLTWLEEKDYYICEEDSTGGPYMFPVYGILEKYKEDNELQGN